MEDKYLCQHYIDQVEDQNNNHDLNSFFLNDDIFLKKHYYSNNLDLFAIEHHIQHHIQHEQL